MPIQNTQKFEEDLMVRQTKLYFLLFSGLTMLGTAVHFSVYSAFLLAHGLNLLQVNLVNVAFYVTLFVFEIPTGAFADVYGRKASYVVSCFLWGIGSFIYASSSSFWMFALAEATVAVGATFSSGAFEAWAVDRLKHHGYTGDLRWLFTRKQYVVQPVSLVAGLVGAQISQHYLTLPWWLGGIILSATGILAILLLKEEYFLKQKFSWRNGLRLMKQTVQVSVEYGLKSKTIRFILVIGAVQYLCLMAPNMQWQPFFLRFFSGRGSLGYLWAGMVTAIMLGAMLVKPVLARVKSERRALLLVQMSIGTTLVSMAVTATLPAALTIFLLNELARGMFNPLKDAYLHDSIPSRERATIVSFESIAHHVGGAIGLVLSGLVANSFGIPVAWVVSGTILIFGSLLVAKNGSTA